ncbi:DUF1194 domain-containing protein [uncultured Roseibium sp.]|uniref:DUF1194 domain-containing protein n=1 Tax=uncultured Roseibium sp. TaxID=1936171 RepID=UPI0026360AAD|nr:DUF1194 domain-containing protein [uncultured Roseibium sp.]
MSHLIRKAACDVPGLSPAQIALRPMVLLVFLLFPASAARACSLALVLAVDVSASITEEEYELQQSGIAIALKHPDVIKAIEAVGGIWLHSFEWSGRYQQNTLLDWRYLSDETSISAAGDAILATTRDHREFMTSLGAALVHATDVLSTAPERCDRQVIDVSADGINNEGDDPFVAYATRDFSDVTVNALVIRKEERTFRYFVNKVITGPGAFAQPINTYEDYTEGMVRKLVREIMGLGFADLRSGDLGHAGTRSFARRPPSGESSR